MDDIWLSICEWIDNADYLSVVVSLSQVSKQLYDITRSNSIQKRMVNIVYEFPLLPSNFSDWYTFVLELRKNYNSCLNFPNLSLSHLIPFAIDIYENSKLLTIPGNRYYNDKYMIVSYFVSNYVRYYVIIYKVDSRWKYIHDPKYHPNSLFKEKKIVWYRNDIRSYIGNIVYEFINKLDIMKLHNIQKRLIVIY